MTIAAFLLSAQMRLQPGSVLRRERGAGALRIINAEIIPRAVIDSG